MIPHHPTATRKQILALLVLAAFLTMVFFSVAAMTYGTDGSMKGDCPFSAMGTSLCPQDALTGALHHISEYLSVLSVPVVSNIVMTILAALIACLGFVFLLRPLLLDPPASSRYAYDSLPRVSYRREIIHWLSLLENSPAL